MFEVPDALADPRFADNPLVTAEQGIRFGVVAVPADPDVVLSVDREAVVGPRPDVPFTRTAPRVDEIALGVELRADLLERRVCMGMA